MRDDLEEIEILELAAAQVISPAIEQSKVVVVPGFIGETTSEFLNDGIHFGFNVSRVFNVVKSKSEYPFSTKKSKRFDEINSPSGESSSSGGQYWMKFDIQCIPGGATVGSQADGITDSINGSSDLRKPKTDHLARCH